MPQSDDEFEERMRRFDAIGKAFASSYNNAQKGKKPHDPLTDVPSPESLAPQQGRPLSPQAAQGLEQNAVPIGPGGPPGSPGSPGPGGGPPGPLAGAEALGASAGAPPPMTEEELEKVRRGGFGPA